MKLIVGLGNPGKEYEHTRHNIGFRVVDIVQEKLHAPDWDEKPMFKAWVSREKDILLAKPTTYMNNSGDAIRLLTKHHRLTPEDVLIVYDEIDIVFGKLRIRSQGSAAGHNGVASILKALGTDEVRRFRFGIGPKMPEQKPAEDFVLERFTDEQENVLKKTLPTAADAILNNLSDGSEETIHLL
ncbi:MAG: aminoacyl-tRNA hydrolase [Patescibacteria group bacterium]|jgi:PTH1 family peptidyl-tRNA hydrolase